MCQPGKKKLIPFAPVTLLSVNSYQNSKKNFKQVNPTNFSNFSLIP